MNTPRRVLLLLGCILAALSMSALHAHVSPVTELERRLAACGEDIDCRSSVAAWAAEKGMIDEADLIYRRILIRHPMLDEPYQALVALNKQRQLPKDSRAFQEARKLLGDRFIEYETRRFIVLSDADPTWSRSQSEHLERAHHQFTRFVTRLSLRPLPLRHKLVCVLFDQRDDYQHFAATHDGIADPWIVGYYAPRHDRVVFYHRSGDEDDNDEYARRVSIATTIHEAIHQLHFHTRVKSLQVQYPLWICEGLATAFETDTPNEAFGPDHEFLPRRDRFYRSLKADELLPLQQLVALTRMPDSRPETVRAVYHQSYALVVWLHRFRSTQLRDYLYAMLQEPHGRVDDARQLELFEQAFGNIEQLEQAWLTHERQALAAAPETSPDPLPLIACTCQWGQSTTQAPDLQHDLPRVRLARWMCNVEEHHAHQ